MKTYVIVGLGARSLMYREALAGQFSDTSSVLAICDRNAGRMRAAEEELKPAHPELLCYACLPRAGA